MNLFAVLLVQLLGILGIAADPQGDTDGGSGDIVLATVRTHQGDLVYRAHVYGLHDSNELTGTFAGGAYFNRDGLFRPEGSVDCGSYSYRHIYRQGNSIAEIRFPRSCLPAAQESSVELTLLKLDPHETAYPVYEVADTVTLPTLGK